MPLPTSRRPLSPTLPAISPHQPRATDATSLLERIVDTPLLAQAIPRLQPELLHALIRRCGLEDSSALVALATPAQLSALFDLDLWRSPQPGGEERFDAGRFGIWLEVLMELGAEAAARTLAALDPRIVITALAQHLRVFDLATLLVTIDGEVSEREIEAEFIRDIGGYRIVARRTDAWDTVVEVLAALNTWHIDVFHRLMRGCRNASNGERETDGLDNLLSDNDQSMFDRAIERERRREARGYVSPAQARTFLQMARTLPLGVGSTPPPANPIAGAHLADAGALGSPDRPPGGGDDASFSDPPPVELLDLLLAAAAPSRSSQALIGDAASEPSRLARVHAQLEFVRERHTATYASRSAELVFLANVLIAGCSIHARTFTPQEAADAATSVCNLGLEQWPPHWLPRRHVPVASSAATLLPEDFLLGHDLVTVFQVGWSVLYDQTCRFASQRLIATLGKLRCTDRDIRIGLKALRLELTRHLAAGEPWRASESLDVLTSLDMPAWAALQGLIAECPTAHAALTASRGLRSVSADDFAFISESRQLAAVGEFMTALPERLRTEGNPSAS